MTPVDVFRVALDMPLKRLFDYLPPDRRRAVRRAPIEPGMRVRVPFGRQRLVGIVMEAADSSDIPPERLKPILEVLDRGRFWMPPRLALLRWAAEYYHHPIGEVLSTALPKALRLGADAEAREERWSGDAEGVEAYDAGRAEAGAEAAGAVGVSGRRPGVERGRVSRGGCRRRSCAGRSRSPRRPRRRMRKSCDGAVPKLARGR